MTEARYGAFPTVLVVSYEDLRKDPRITLSRMVAHLFPDRTLEPGRADAAVEALALGRVRQLEHACDATGRAVRYPDCSCSRVDMPVNGLLPVRAGF